MTYRNTTRYAWISRANESIEIKLSLRLLFGTDNRITIWLQTWHLLPSSQSVKVFLKEIPQFTSSQHGMELCVCTVIRCFLLNARWCHLWWWHCHDSAQARTFHRSHAFHTADRTSFHSVFDRRCFQSFWVADQARCCSSQVNGTCWMSSFPADYVNQSWHVDSPDSSTTWQQHSGPLSARQLAHSRCSSPVVPCFWILEIQFWVLIRVVWCERGWNWEMCERWDNMHIQTHRWRKTMRMKMRSMTMTAADIATPVPKFASSWASLTATEPWNETKGVNKFLKIEFGAVCIVIFLNKPLTFTSWFIATPLAIVHTFP